MLVLIAASGVYYYCHTIIHDPVFVKPEETDLIFQVESVATEADDIVISGWCFEEDTDTKQGSQPAFKVLLKPFVEEEGVAVEPYLSFRADYGQERSDVGAYLNGEHDYTYSGFQVRIPVSELEKDAGADSSAIYEIALQQNERLPDAVMTGVLLQNGERITDTSRGIDPVSVEGTDLEPIVAQGYLCVSRPDIGAFVYQVDHELYYIVNDQFRFDEGWDYLQLQPRTTQLEKLPPARFEAGYTYDSLEFLFTYHEITNDMNAGSYRVAKVELPSAYGVTTVETGFYQSENDEWVWKETFLPDYTQLIH